MNFDLLMEQLAGCWDCFLVVLDLMKVDSNEQEWLGQTAYMKRNIRRGLSTGFLCEGCS